LEKLDNMIRTLKVPSRFKPWKANILTSQRSEFTSHEGSWRPNVAPHVTTRKVFGGNPREAMHHCEILWDQEVN
jgi:hypothetical protein